MARRAFKNFVFKTETLALISVINGIINEYLKQGFRLTVRQLYYQLVARELIENTLSSYRRITSTVNDARLAGYIDWDAIEDRTREFLRKQRWESGGDILRVAAEGYHMDMWQGQKHRVFVIVEKEALSGVLEPVCRKYDVPLLAARGYPSVSVLYEFVSKDIEQAFAAQQIPVLLHLGDHDPSGIDMTRDLSERLYMLADETDVEVKRIALSMDQIRSLRPPPNPAKETDSRFRDYRAKYGDKSWELDALSPRFLANLVSFSVDKYIDKKAWEQRAEEVEQIRGRLLTLADEFEN